MSNDSPPKTCYTILINHPHITSRNSAIPLASARHFPEGEKHVNRTNLSNRTVDLVSWCCGDVPFRQMLPRRRGGAEERRVYCAVHVQRGCGGVSAVAAGGAVDPVRRAGAVGGGAVQVPLVFHDLRGERAEAPGVQRLLQGNAADLPRERDEACSGPVPHPTACDDPC